MLVSFNQDRKIKCWKTGESSNHKYCEGLSLFPDSSIDLHMETLRWEVRCYYIYCTWRIKQLTENTSTKATSQFSERQKILLNVTKLSFFLYFLHSYSKYYVKRMYSRFNVWNMPVPQCFKRILIIVMVAIQGKRAPIRQINRNKNGACFSTVIITLYEFFIIKQCLITWPCEHLAAQWSPT